MMGAMADMAVPDEIIEARDGRPEIIIRRSARRRRTLSARMEGSSVLVMVPMGMRKADQDRQVMELVDKVTKCDARRRHHDSNDELTRRALRLCQKYLDPRVNDTVEPRIVALAASRGQSLYVEGAPHKEDDSAALQAATLAHIGSDVSREARRGDLIGSPDDLLACLFQQHLG